MASHAALQRSSCPLSIDSHFPATGRQQEPRSSRRNSPALAGDESSSPSTVFKMSSTVTMRPVHIAPLGVMPERLYMIPEHPDVTYRPGMRPSTAPLRSTPMYPAYPRPQTPSSGRREPAGSMAMPVALKRPKKLSRASGSSHSTTENPNLATNNPQQAGAANKGPESSGLRAGYWQSARDAPAKDVRTRAKPDATLASLPGEILEVVLKMLKEMHLGGSSDSCATCWMRDLCSLSLCSPDLSRAARRAL